MRRIISGTAFACLLIFASVATAAPPRPVADFAVSPQPAVRNSPTTFTSTGTCPIGPCTYRWTQGDASSPDLIGTGRTVSFTYTGPAGTRTVTLTVTDRKNRAVSRTRSFQLVDPSSPPPAAQCSDGRDNDGDGLTDYPADPGCSSATDNDEANVVQPPAPPGGLPGPDNTGVPPGTTLTPRTGPVVISTPGTVLNGLDITYSGSSTAVQVNADNVTIRNTRIRSNGIALIQNDNHNGLLVEDSELLNRPVAGQPNCHNGIAMGQYTVRRTEIAGCENGAEMAHGNTLFEDNWVHNLDTVGPSYVFGTAGPHTDGIQLNGGGHDAIIRHNTIEPIAQGTTTGGYGTSGIIANSGGDNVRIEDNRISGNRSSYAIYAPRTAKTAWFINRNQLVRGVGGYTACVKLGNTVTAFDGNVDAGTNALISPDNGVGGGCTN